MGSFRNLILNASSFEDEYERSRQMRHFATPGIPAVSSMHITLQNVRKTDANSWRARAARLLTSSWYHSSVAVAVMVDAFAISVVRFAMVVVAMHVTLAMCTALLVLLLCVCVFVAEYVGRSR
jgi:hypothetical protein